MMTKTPFFIAGLPRSGSTLLGAILEQNPRFHTEPASPVLDFIISTNKVLERNEHYIAFPKQNCVLKVLQSLFQTYYSNTEKPVIFDKNRSWPAHIAGLEQGITPRAKVLCPVRNIDEILASLLSLAHLNPFDPKVGRLNFIDHSLVMANLPINDENRCKLILSDHGMIGKCMLIMQDAIRKNYRDRLHFVEYDELTENPTETLNKIYEFLEEEPFTHHFEGINKKSNERDLEAFSVPTLHKIRPTLEKSKTDPKKILPENFLKETQGTEFWRSL
jgi:sulfotransferase